MLRLIRPQARGGQAAAGAGYVDVGRGRTLWDRVPACDCGLWGSGLGACGRACGLVGLWGNQTEIRFRKRPVRYRSVLLHFEAAAISPGGGGLVR